MRYIFTARSSSVLAGLVKSLAKSQKLPSARNLHAIAKASWFTQSHYGQNLDHNFSHLDIQEQQQHRSVFMQQELAGEVSTAILAGWAEISFSAGCCLSSVTAIRVFLSFSPSEHKRALARRVMLVGRERERRSRGRKREREREGIYTSHLRSKNIR